MTLGKFVAWSLFLVVVAAAGGLKQDRNPSQPEAPPSQASVQMAASPAMAGNDSLDAKRALNGTAASASIQ